MHGQFSYRREFSYGVNPGFCQPYSSCSQHQSFKPINFIFLVKHPKAHSFQMPPLQERWCIQDLRNIHKCMFQFQRRVAQKMRKSYVHVYGHQTKRFCLKTVKFCVKKLNIFLYPPQLRTGINILQEKSYFIFSTGQNFPRILYSLRGKS